MDTFKIIDNNTVAWLRVTGSGNETSAHLLENGRITIMFCSFSETPNILRLYGTATEVLPNHEEWNQYYSFFPNIPGTRQIFIVQLETIQTSCGMSIPYYDYKGERNQLNNWAENKGIKGINSYWKEKNQLSIDGLKTKFYKKD